MSKNILITGAAGFIGSHLCEHLLKNTDWTITIIDRLTYAGNLSRLAQMDIWEKERRRVTFKYHDFRSPFTGKVLEQITEKPLNYIIHMGGETHVGNSLKQPLIFAESNVIGTINMLELAKFATPDKFLFVSTDEVYGPVEGDQLHVEGEPHRPSNPYSASKSGAEDFCYAYLKSFGVPVIITNTMNNFGERQDAEKFVPMVLKNIVSNQPVNIHCKLSPPHEDCEQAVLDISSRCWLHARNHADGLLFIIDHGKIGERYNIVGVRRNVLEMAEMIAKFAKCKLDPKFIDFHTYSPGHDLHYGLDGSKLVTMGWQAPFDFESSLKKTVKWTMDHSEWL